MILIYNGQESDETTIFNRLELDQYEVLIYSSLGFFILLLLLIFKIRKK